MATVISVSATGNADIDGLLGGTAWSGTVTYSFADSPSDYVAGYGQGEPTDPSFAQVPTAIQSAINYAIGLIESYTNVSVQFAGSGTADIMVAQSAVANPTSWAYLPDPNYTEGGDVWFGTAYDFSQAALGNYYFQDALHELGHSFGLKHPDTLDGVANVAVPAAHDDIEYTVMSYSSYIGASTDGYVNEDYGYAQTYMANDILALQTLYGANYSTHSENTVYSWSPTTGQEFINGVAQLAPGDGTGGSANRIFETIWDGNGVDTYDLSNYTTGVSINLNPGASSIASTTQLAYLGDGNYAQGNIYNADLFNNDARSYIENAIGGSGDDILIGNAVANTLTGGAGNDIVSGGGGDDILIGGTGNDTLNGDTGTNSALYSSLATAGLVAVVQGARGTVSKGGTNGTDHLTNIQRITGSTGGDVFYVDANENVTGGGGFDYLIELTAGVNLSYGNSFTGISEFVTNTGNNTVNFAADTNIAYLYGSTGNDTLTLGTGGGYLFGGAGANVLTGGANATNIMVGGPGGTDTMNGGGGTANNFYYVDGNDQVNGGGSFNVLIELVAGVTVQLGSAQYQHIQEFVAYGGSNVVTVAGTDSDFVYLYGGAGNDTLTTGSGGGYLFGEGGTNVLTGGGGTNIFVADGSSGVDIMNGGSGSNLFYIDANSTVHGAGTFNNVIELQQNASLVLGSAQLGTNVQQVILNGGTNSADFHTATSTVSLYGGTGNDTLFGGTGSDFLYGGLGTNTFKFAAGWGQDIIEDWTAGTNSIIDLTQLASLGVHAITDLTQTIIGGNDTITSSHTGTNSITLLGVGHVLTASDFHLA